MYLQYYALAFFLYFIIDKKNKQSWLLLSALCLLLKLNTVIFDVTCDYRYIVKCSITLVFALLLIKCNNLSSIYQSIILLLFLVVNALMLNNISNGNFFYANYEAIIYGLVACQLFAILPGAWRCIRDIFTSYISSNKNKRMVGSA
tara:strand:+ start:40 stop:477 length:438 start_codon:yes stop_codon:yes gene_type:complete